MKSAFHLAPLYAQVISSMGWLFMYSDISKEPNYFLTSDCPVTVIRPGDLFSTNQGLINPDIEISMPLSRDMAFLAWNRWEGIRHGDVNADNIMAINARTAMFGKRFLFAPKTIFPGSGKIEEDIWKGVRLKPILPRNT